MAQRNEGKRILLLQVNLGSGGVWKVKFKYYLTCEEGGVGQILVSGCGMWVYFYVSNLNVARKTVYVTVL